MRKIYRKPHRIKRKKSIIHNRFFRLGILFFILAFLLFYSFTFFNFFQIKKIIILGETISEETAKEIKLTVEENINKKILSLFHTKSIFLANSSQLTKNILDDFPEIFSIKISKDFPDVLNISVDKREGVAVFSSGEQNFLIDKEGIIFDFALSEDLSLNITNNQKIGPFTLGEKVIKEDLLSQILKVQSKLQEDSDIFAAEFFLISEERINVKTSEGWEIYFNPKKDLDWQLTELNLVLERKIPKAKRGDLEYIDLRFSRVYYK
ncbi:MAG: cell division protein FtsQ/DivIB [Candidatus Nealsonbacteria bacterium]